MGWIERRAVDGTAEGAAAMLAVMAIGTEHLEIEWIVHQVRCVLGWDDVVDVCHVPCVGEVGVTACTAVACTVERLLAGTVEPLGCAVEAAGMGHGSWSAGAAAGAFWPGPYVR